MLVSEETVDDTPALEGFTWKALPLAAAVAACVRTEVSRLERAFSPFIMPPTLALFISDEEPLMRPSANWSVKDWVALERVLAPRRTLPILMMVVRSERSRLPVAWRIL